MPWYKKSLTVNQIINGTNENIRKEFSYIYKMLTFRPKDMFLVSQTDASKGVSLYISPGSVKHVQGIIDKYTFLQDVKPTDKKIIVIVGEQEDFKKIV